MEKGMLAGLLALVLALLGIMTFGPLFIPIAAVVAVIGTVRSILAGQMPSLGVNILAWVFIVIGVATSPSILALLFLLLSLILGAVGLGTGLIPVPAGH